MFYRSDDPLADFARWDEDQQRWLESRPKCTDCGEHIQDEEAYHINGQWICPECMKDYLKEVD